MFISDVCGRNQCHISSGDVSVVLNGLKLLHFHYIINRLGVQKPSKLARFADLRPFWTHMRSRSLCLQISLRKYQEGNTEGSGWKVEEAETWYCERTCFLWRAFIKTTHDIYMHVSINMHQPTAITEDHMILGFCFMSVLYFSTSSHLH